jgi:hypothetical protein
VKCVQASGLLTQSFSEAQHSHSMSICFLCLCPHGRICIRGEEIISILKVHSSVTVTLMGAITISISRAVRTRTQPNRVVL